MKGLRTAIVAAIALVGAAFVAVCHPDSLDAYGLLATAVLHAVKDRGTVEDLHAGAPAATKEP